MDEALSGVVDAYGLTAMQEGMLYHTLADRGSGVYVNQIVTPVSGDLDVSLLRSAWDSVVARHDTLRTAFVWDGLDDPLQVVHAAVDHPWEDVNLAHVPQGDRDQQVDRVLASDRGRGFDVATAPLSRMLLIRTGEREWQWVWSFHHLIADGWSAQILLDDVIATYRASAEGRHLELAEQPPYRDFVAHYLARDTDAEQTYWTQRLAGFAEPLDLVVPGLPPTDGASGYRTQYRSLDRALTDDIGALARSHHVTLNTVFVAIWALIVARWAGAKDVVFGTTVAGRPPSLERAEQATGLFINTLPMRVRLPPTARLGEWLNEIQRGQLDDRRFELASLADIQRWSDVPSGDALFESILVFENYPPRVDRRLGESISLGHAQHVEQSNYPLAVLVIPGDELTVGVVHDLARLSEPAVESLLDQVGAVARAFVANPHGTVSGFSVVDDAHEARIAAISRGPDLTVDDATIVEMISAVATRSPDRPAVTCAGRHLTHAELDQASSRLARLLVRRGVGRGAPVGVHLPRSPDLVVAILGVLKAAAAYVPLDPAYPRAHLVGLIDDTAITTIVTNSDLAPAMREVGDLVVIDAKDPDDPTIALPSVSSDDLAYVIHTSGSTGRPKGVMVAHGTLAASTRARPVHYKEPVNRFLLLSSYAFDSSVAGIFWTLTTGGALVLPEPNLERDVDALLDLAEREQVTHTLALPSLYQVLVEHAGRGELDSLRVAIVAGEACPAGVLASHRGTVGHAELHNEYGPTEATVWCTVHRADVGDEDRALPIGRPIAGSEIHLLDPYGHRVPLGFAGELCVGGAGVTLGYFGRADLTAERFLTIPLDGQHQRIYRTGDLAAYASDGTLVFLGRTDQQLKIRGHRIESGAIEAHLHAHPEVEEAAAIARPIAGRSGAQLVGYVVPSGPGFDARAVSEALRRELPEYLVPDILMAIDAIPKLPNGKLDVASLPDPRVGSHGPEPAPDVARTPQEEILASIWCDLLGLDSVGIHDDFFSLGGDSIVSLRMVSRARQAGLDLPLNTLLTNPTIESLGRVLDGPSSLDGERRCLVAIHTAGNRVPLIGIHSGMGFVLHYRQLWEQLGPDQPMYVIEPVGLDGITEPLDSVPAMAARYVGELREVQPSGPYRLIGNCFGGVVALEMAGMLEAAGEQVELVAVVDGTLPLHPARRQTVVARGVAVYRKRGALATRRKARARMTKRLGPPPTGSPGGEGGLVDARIAVLRAVRRAFGTYQPKPIAAPILLVRSSRDQVVGEGHDWHMGWGEYTQSFEVATVDSTVEDMFRTPVVETLAAILRAHTKAGDEA